MNYLTNAKQNNNDSKLLQQLRAGETAALQQVYNTYSPRLYVNLLKLVKDETAAHELLQDIFIKLWLKRKELAIVNLGAYLFTMSANIVCDYFRKQRNNVVFTDNVIAIASQYYTHVEELIFSKETSVHIQQALYALPPKRRQVFELCKLEGKSYTEVSTLLGISVSTINDHIVKATKTLLQHLKPQ